MPHELSALVRWVIALTATALAGCSSMERDFPGYTRDQVWKAMVETAEDPRYPDWIVVDNEVFRDDGSATVEIRRDIRRDVVIVGQKPRREEREWRFTANVTSTEPPTLVFASRSPSIPAHFWSQGRQFMNEVERRLAGVALPPPRSGKSIERPDATGVDPAQPLVQTARGSEVRSAGREPSVPADIPEPSAMRASATNPRKAATPAPAAEPVPEPKPEPAPAPAAEPVPEPKPEPAPAPASEPVPEPKPEPEPTPPYEPPPEPSREPTTDPSIAPKPAPTPPAAPPFEPPPEPDQPVGRPSSLQT